MRTESGRRQAALWLLPLGWYAVIWAFSAQTGVQSSQISDGVLENVFALDIANTPMVLTALLSFLVRKAGHMFIFFVLTGLFILPLRTLDPDTKVQGLAAAILTVILAAADEFHQTFVPGRSGTLRDVGIDALGAVCFLVVWWAVGRLRRRGTGPAPDA